MDINAIISETNLYLRNFDSISLPRGGLTDKDLQELYALIYSNSYKTNHNIEGIKIADIGCWTGTSSILFGEIAKALSGKLWSIDWFAGSQNTNLELAGKYFNIKKIFMDNINRFNFGDIITVLDKTSEEASKEFKDNSLDIVFIDADHRYEYIKRDIELWYPKVKIGGLLCGHDCEILLKNGINTLYEIYKDKDIIEVLHLGVIRAVSELLPEAKKTTEGSIWYYLKI
jgi:SAM-dependent methyltransferase